MQLAMYAHSIAYDIGTDTRTDDPEPIDLNVGIIIHVPAGGGRCDLYEINLNEGWRACILAKNVWGWRGIKDLTHLVGDTRPHHHVGEVRDPALALLRRAGRQRPDDRRFA